MTDLEKRNEFLRYYYSWRYTAVRFFFLASLLGMVLGILTVLMTDGFVYIVALVVIALIAWVLSRVILDDSRKAARWVR